MSLKEILHDFISLFFPRYCFGCSQSLVKGEQSICTKCMLELPQTNYHLDDENALKQRLSLRIPVEYAVAFLKFAKNGRVQHILHALKYKGNAEIGITLGKAYGERLREAGFETRVDCIIPVPLHPSRLRRRGYNQSEKFGEGLAHALNLPCLPHLVKRRVKTQTQTRRNRLKRWENVADVFLVVDEKKLSGLRVLLVDDVVTTGATLEACANQLLSNGCNSVSIACIAEA